MDNKKSMILWGSLLILFLLMIFVEMGCKEKHKDEAHEDEIIYLSYEEDIPPFIEQPLPAIEPEIIVEPVVAAEPIVPDLGRLAITSVMINKKSNSQITTEISPENATIKQAEQQQDLVYKIFQGHRFSAVLTHAIHSDLPGMVVAEISQNVYGYQSYIPLLPTGTRLIGHYNSRLNIGDTRLYIIWQRAITPSGVDIQLDSIGTDRLGQTGSSGIIDTHFWETFGTSSLLSVMAVGASNLSEDQGEMSNQYQQGVTDALMDSSHTILMDRMQRRPTIHIPQGEIVHVMVEKDLDFSQVLKQIQKIQVF